MKILVTGGTGYVGSHAVVELIQAGHQIEILDNLCNSKISVLDKIAEITGVRPVFHQLDLLDQAKLAEVFASGQYDAVLHFAGLKSVAESVENPLKYYQNNVTGTINLLSVMQASGVKRIIFSSSATVYGDPGTVAYTEDLPAGQNISSPYGKTKYIIEEMIRDLSSADSEFEATILRYFNPIGAHSSGKIGENPNGRPNNLMPLIMKVARDEYPELSIYGNDYPTRDGTCIRDYVHVTDIARGHLLALDHLKRGVEIYNLGSGAGTSVLELVSAFATASGRELPYRFAPRRAGDLPEFYAVFDKAKRELGWEPVLTIKDAMHDTLNFLSNREN